MKPIQIGNQLGIFPVKTEDKNQRLFKINTFGQFQACINMIAAMLKNGKEVHVQLLSKDKFKLFEIRSAYFAYLGERVGYGDIEETHDQLKAKYLIPLLCSEYEWFSDLVLTVTKTGNKDMEEAINRLVSVADGSITTTPIVTGKQWY